MTLQKWWFNNTFIISELLKLAKLTRAIGVFVFKCNLPTRQCQFANYNNLDFGDKCNTLATPHPRRTRRRRYY